MIPENFANIDELSDFWDTHSTADYEDMMEPVTMDIDISHRLTYCAIASDVFRAIKNHADKQGVSIETMINVWLQEKLTALQK